MKERISVEDRADLTAYFSGLAFARLSASPLGPMLDRLAAYGSSRNCPACDGVGRLDVTNPAAKKRSELHGEIRRRGKAWVVTAMKHTGVKPNEVAHLTEYRRLMIAASTAEDRNAGYAAAERYRKANIDAIGSEARYEGMEAGVRESADLRLEMARVRKEEAHDPLSGWCEGCGGRRVIGCELVKREPADDCEDHPAEVPEDPATLDDLPRDCVGDGCFWIHPMPTMDESLMHVHETIVSSGVVMGEPEMELLGRVGSRLSRVEPRLAAALGLMFFPGGSGGPASLFAITETGKRLIDAHRRSWRSEPTYQQFMEAEGREPNADEVLDRVRSAQKDKPTVRIGSMLSDVRHEAEEMAKEAVRAWEHSRGDRYYQNVQGPSRERIKAKPSQELRELSDLVKRALGGV